MADVRVKALLGRSREELREVEFLVDTGSFWTMLPPSLTTQLGITPALKTEVVLADKRKVEIDFSSAYLRVDDREGAIPIGVLDVPIPLLGVSALEALGLKVNPAEGTLKHSRPFGPFLL